MVLRLELRTAMFAALLSVLALAGGALAGEMETSQPQRTPTVELVERGRATYTSYCVRCHGVNMVTTGSAFDLRRFPHDQRERFEQSVLNGVRAMPAWKALLQPEDVSALWAYVLSGSS